MRMKRPSQTRNCTVQIRNELKPRTFVNLLQCSPKSVFRDFAPGCTPQTVLIHLKKAFEGMIVPKCEFENHEEQTFLKGRFSKFSTSVEHRYYIFSQPTNSFRQFFFQEVENTRIGCLFCTGDRSSGRLISRKDGDLYHCATTFVRRIDVNFTNWAKKFDQRPKAAEIFFNVNTVFPEFLAPQNDGWLTTETRNQCCRSRTLPKTASSFDKFVC